MSVDPIINETQLNIILDTNIPGEKQFSFTKSVLSNDLLKNTGDFSEYPYFTSNIPYPESVLKKLDYSNQVAFFFKQSEFIRILKDTSEYISASKIIEEEEKKFQDIRQQKFNEKRNKRRGKISGGNAEYETKIKNTKQNIMIMLSIIFPTNYPTQNNIMNSYDLIYTNILSASSISNVLPFLLNMTLGIQSTKQKYSYINSPSKGKCTVTQIIWLNDIYNHPEYKTIVEKYDTFQNWKITEITKLEYEMNNEIKIYKKAYKNGLENLAEILNKRKTEIEKLMDINNQRLIKEKKMNDKNDFNIFIGKLNLIIKEINKLNNHYMDLIIFKRKYHNIYKFIKDEISLISNFNMQLLLQSIDTIELNSEIINKYLKASTIQIEGDKNSLTLSREEKELQQRITKWNGYNKYNEFINLLKTFQKSSNESYNIYLQEVIDDFIRGDTDNEFEELMYPSNIQSSAELIKLIQTGINIKSSNPIKHTIYLRMDVIAGELNDSNKNSIYCVFNGEYLGNELNQLLKENKNYWELTSNRFFFDLNTMKANMNDSSKADTKIDIKPDKKMPTNGRKNKTKKNRL